MRDEAEVPAAIMEPVSSRKSFHWQEAGQGIWEARLALLGNALRLMQAVIRAMSAL